MTKDVNDNPLSECLAEKDDSFVLTLPVSLQGEQATYVADLLLSARGNPVAVDASAVERIDTPCIQVLLSAARLWREEGVALELSGESGVFTENLNTLGLTKAELEVGDANHA
ncbi:MAG: STAS domain-containing protein [Oricola sp.]